VCVDLRMTKSQKDGKIFNFFSLLNSIKVIISRRLGCAGQAQER
jgi:hypothetical protein